MKKLSPILILLLLITACIPRQLQKKISFSGMAQGTYYSVTYFDHLDRNFQQEIDSLLIAFDMAVSMWEPASLISRINRGEDSVICDSAFINTYLLARKVAEETGGAFDFTVGSLVNAWGFGFEDRQKVDQALLDSLLPLVGYRLVTLEGNQIIKEKPGISFDFNAVAQGYSVDLLSDFLASKGLKNYLVDIGGEVLAIGEKPGIGPWVIGIEKPSMDEFSERELEASITLTNRAMATSGNYRKFYEENGIRYSHTINPETGYPVTHTLLSASVIADDCGSADAYATAFMVMGLDKSVEFLESRTELEAFFIYSGENGKLETYVTEGMEDLLCK
ncbi:MAG: FAD:protein FMN transferase [Bacteroidetes bacterium]|nr:FAD:protein FMN transferase [Bacteroidota bacterium]